MQFNNELVYLSPINPEHAELPVFMRLFAGPQVRLYSGKVVEAEIAAITNQSAGPKVTPGLERFALMGISAKRFGLPDHAAFV
jgi:hypothetical protein